MHDPNKTDQCECDACKLGRLTQDLGDNLRKMCADHRAALAENAALRTKLERVLRWVIDNQLMSKVVKDLGLIEEPPKRADVPGAGYPDGVQEEP